MMKKIFLIVVFFLALPILGFAEENTITVGDFSFNCPQIFETEDGNMYVSQSTGEYFVMAHEDVALFWDLFLEDYAEKENEALTFLSGYCEGITSKRWMGIEEYFSDERLLKLNGLISYTSGIKQMMFSICPTGELIIVGELTSESENIIFGSIASNVPIW